MAGESDELGAEVLAALRFAAWPAVPCRLEKRPATPASTASGDNSPASGEASESDGEDIGLRPRKLRVLQCGSSPAGLLARRTYTWRGISSRRADKQQRQLDAMQQQQQATAAAVPAVAVAATSPAHSTGGGGTAFASQATHGGLPASAAAPLAGPQQQQALEQQQPAPAAVVSPACSAPAAAPAASPTGGSGGGSKEGDRDWAALTTWLRMNLHRPRTSKKVVLFVGQQAAGSGGRWTFGLNPALSWHDVSADTRRRLHHLPAEAAQAFARKYPGRPPSDWLLKSQKYQPPGGSQTHLVQVQDVVLSLHALYQRHEGISGSSSSCGTAAAAAGGGRPGDLASALQQ